MSKNFTDELTNIDNALIGQWNLYRAFESLFSSFTSEKNIEKIGMYNHIDEKDILEITYLILKYAHGKDTPTYEEMARIATKLTFRKILDETKMTQHYSLYNGDMPDFHLFYFLNKLFDPYFENLFKEHGFNHHILWQIKFFLNYHPSFIFTLNDVEEMFKNFFDDKEVGDAQFDMFAKFIERFSDEPNLENFEDFQKGIAKKPIIKLSKDEYVLCWHWLRTNVIINFHYMLSDDETYKKYRSDVFEKITASLFRHHLRSNDRVHTNVTYKDGEIDVLIDAENTILLVECKSGIVYEKYKMGVVDEGVKRNIDSITGRARNQLHNAKNALLSQKDIRSNGLKLKLDTDKEVLLLNICFEFPVGLSNKDRSEEVIVLSIIDLMIIIELMDERLFGEPNVKNIIEYLGLRKRALGFATDDELTIAISLLYNPSIDTFIDDAKLLGSLHLNSNKSVSDINHFYSFLLKAKILGDDKEYELVRENYQGFFREYILNV